MSHSASGRLKSAGLELADALGRSRETWRDAKAEEFQNQHIQPMLRSVEVACLAMDEIATVFAQMKRECGPPRDGET